MSIFKGVLIVHRILNARHSKGVEEFEGVEVFEVFE